MSKKQLRKDEIEEFDRILHKQYHLEDFFRKKRVELEDDFKLFCDGALSFVKKENLWIPSLHLLQKNNFLKTVTVDMGAVKFVCGGADVMRPGIAAFDADIQKDEIIAIIDQLHKKPLAVGKIIMTGTEAQALQKGKIIQNLHYVGDEFWNSQV